MITKAMLSALQGTGCEILEEDYDGFIVMKNDGNLLFAEPQVRFGEIVEQIEVEHKRFDFEKVSCMYVSNHDDVKDCRIMFSIAQLFVLGPDRGMLRHVIDWTNSHDIKCTWDIMTIEED